MVYMFRRVNPFLRGEMMTVPAGAGPVDSGMNDMYSGVGVWRNCERKTEFSKQPMIRYEKVRRANRQDATGKQCPVLSTALLVGENIPNPLCERMVNMRLRASAKRFVNEEGVDFVDCICVHGMLLCDISTHIEKISYKCL